jgi:hypothetical protein
LGWQLALPALTSGLLGRKEETNNGALGWHCWPLDRELALGSHWVVMDFFSVIKAVIQMQ